MTLLCMLNNLLVARELFLAPKDVAPTNRKVAILRDSNPITVEHDDAWFAVCLVMVLFMLTSFHVRFFIANLTLAVFTLEVGWLKVDVHNGWRFKKAMIWVMWSLKQDTEVWVVPSVERRSGTCLYIFRFS